MTTNIKKEDIKKPSLFWQIIRIFAILMIISFILAGCLSFLIFSGTEDDTQDLSNKNVALIKIYNEITLSSSDSSFFTKTQTSQDIIDFIKTADENKNIKAIILEINSPGGTVLASKEVVDTIKNTNKTTVAWVREIGTSGAYWAASAADHIVADDLSIVGSIGVYSSYLSFGRILENYNITYNQLNAGKYKDIETPLKELTPDEREIIQKKLDIIHDYFIRDVAANRQMTYAQIQKLATGEYYLGLEAKQNGLVDELGNYDTVISYLEKELNTTDITVAEFVKPKNFFERLSEVESKVGYFVGKGIGDSIKLEDTSNMPILK